MSELPVVSTTLSLASVLAEPARRTPDALALIEGERRLTYAEVWREARTVAAQLIADGVTPGDRVALLAPNVVEFVTSYYGILAAGGVVVPVPTLLQGREAAYLQPSFSRGQDGAGSIADAAVVFSITAAF